MAFCIGCGKQLDEGVNFCTSCGTEQDNRDPSLSHNPSIKSDNSEKSFAVTLILCILLGSLGVHRFYVGKIGTGILMLLTFGGLEIWTLVDIIVIAVGNFKDSNGLPIKS